MESDENPEAAPSEKPNLQGWRLYLVHASLYLGLVLSIMDSSAVSTALVTIGAHFDDFVHIQWVVLSYMLTYLGFALAFSRISDVIGRKWATIAALSFITTFSIGCGCAQTIQQLIVFRALQGIGGAGLYSMAFIVLPEVTPPEKLGIMSGLIGGVTVVSAVLGPVVGGIITTYSTWRWVFWFNIPIGGTILVFLLLFCPDFKYRGRITWKQFDFFGCLIYLASCTLLITALQEGGSGSISWTSAAFIICVILAGVIFTCFAAWIAYLSRRKHSVMPLFPMRIVTHRIMLSTILVSTCVGFVFYSILVQLPERFQIVNGKSAEIAGVSLIALSGPSAFGSFLGGALSVKRNNTFYTLLAGCSFVILGTGLMRTIDSSPSVPAKVYGFEVLMGFGFGMLFSTTTVLIKFHADQGDSAAAQGLMSQARLLGGNIGLAIATIVLNQRLISDLKGVVPASEIDSLRHSLLAISLLTPQQSEIVRRSFAGAFVTQLDINLGVAGLMLLVALGTWERRPTTLKDVMERVRKEEEEQRSTQETTESQFVKATTGSDENI